MIRKTGKGLHARDTRHSRFNEFDHLRREEPAFARDVSELDDVVDAFHLLVNRFGRVEATAFAQVLFNRLSERLRKPHEKARNRFGLFREREFFVSENAGRKRIQEKVHHVGHNRFRAFALDRIDDLIVRRRMEFDEDFSDYADARFFDRQKRQRIEIVDDVFDKFVKTADRKGAQLNLRPAVPFFVKRVRRPLHFFIGARPVQNAHKHVAYHRTHDESFEERERHFKSRILFETVRVQRKDGDMSPSRIV